MDIHIVIYYLKYCDIKGGYYVFNIFLKERSKVDAACNKIMQNVSTTKNSYNNDSADFLIILL